MNVQSLLRRGFCCESQVSLLGCRIVTNSCTCVSLIHFTKLLNKKIEGSSKGFLAFFFWQDFRITPYFIMHTVLC